MDIAHQDYQFLSTTIRGDGLVNATALTTAYRNTTGIRKDVKNWLDTKEAKESIAYLGRATGIPVTDLVIVENGVGTWLHPDLAEILAQWISVEYRFAVVELIRRSKQQAEVTQPAAPQQPALPPVTIHQYMEEARLWGLDEDPLIKSLITQRLAEELGAKALPASQSVQVILTVRAAELGYPQSRIGSGSQLGKFVAKLIAPTGKTQHGRYPVNTYELTRELDETIHAFFR